MFRDLTADYTERVDIIGNQKFLEFVDDLEKLEELQLEQFDIGLPVLTPTLVRKKSLAEEIDSLDVMAFQTMLLPLGADDPNNKTFRYEGHDIITLQKIVERDYKVPEPQTAQELIGYYARRIAEAVKLPSQFAALAPKVRQFFEDKSFRSPSGFERHGYSESYEHAGSVLRVYPRIQQGAEAAKYRRARAATLGTGPYALCLSAVSLVPEGVRSESLRLQHDSLRQRLREELCALFGRRGRHQRSCKAAATVWLLD